MPVRVADGRGFPAALQGDHARMGEMFGSYARALEGTFTSELLSMNCLMQTPRREQLPGKFAPRMIEELARLLGP